MKKILITGAFGQIGTELSEYLREKYGKENVITSDIHERDVEDGEEELFERIDVTKMEQLEEAIQKYEVDTVIHLAALLSATAEKLPYQAWRINMDGLTNVLALAQKYHLQVFHPSSIGAFGPTSPRVDTPQVTIQRPTSIYGVSKAAGELLCDYYQNTLDVDVRGVRFPGLISNVALPGGGTTDYAVDIYYQALEKGYYTCYLEEDTYLDMMYMPDALQAIVNLMEADREKLNHYNAYNISGMSICPKDMEASIKKFIPDFYIEYQVDPVRQAIANSWPQRMDIQAAKEDWNFQADFDLDRMTEDMLKHLREKLGK